MVHVEMKTNSSVGVHCNEGTQRKNVACLVFVLISTTMDLCGFSFGYTHNHFLWHNAYARTILWIKK